MEAILVVLVLRHLQGCEGRKAANRLQGCQGGKAIAGVNAISATVLGNFAHIFHLDNHYIY